LVKGLRLRLRLTQEQFARQVGVTFSIVNQWENGRRRPQPFLLKRLLKMEAASGEGSTRHRLAKGEAQDFKRRWDAANASEKEELASMPMVHKFRQVAALLASARKLGWTEGNSAEEELVRERWARLRREYHA
jgi:putative transcriptional regulator